MRNDYKQGIETKKNVKRIAITMCCTIPLLFIVGLLLGENVNRALRIVIFVLLLLVVVLTEEFIYSKINKNKPKVEVEKEDVFK